MNEARHSGQCASKDDRVDRERREESRIQKIE